MRLCGFLAVLVGGPGLLACNTEPRASASPRAASAPIASPAASAQPVSPAAAPRKKQRFVVLAGGDVNLGRDMGQRLLADPDYDPFRGVRPHFEAADVVFANLESPLSHQGGETRRPNEPMAFTGPPSGADALSRASIDVVSIANNHTWDYGLDGFSQTLDHLRVVGVAAAGGSLVAGAQYAPAVIERDGWSVAVFAVTAVWNPGVFAEHEARDHVAWADLARLEPAIREAQARHDLVFVSYHGGHEYRLTPTPEQIHFAREVLGYGADAVFGHHPHVPERVVWVEDRPAFLSLGNLVFGVHRDHPATARAVLARLTFFADGGHLSEACPLVMDGTVRTVSRHGCEPLIPPEEPETVAIAPARSEPPRDRPR